MLKQHSQLMISLLIAADACAVAVAWLASYVLRFALLPVDPGKGTPELWDKFLPMLPLVVLAHLLIFYRVGLYRPRRDGSLGGELRDIGKAFLVAIVAVVLIDYALPATNKISRQFIATYAVLGAACFVAFRGPVRLALRAARRRGWNRRTAAIIGTGRTAQRLLHALRRNSWTGIDVLYFVAETSVPADGGTAIDGGLPTESAQSESVPDPPRHLIGQDAGAARRGAAPHAPLTANGAPITAAATTPGDPHAVLGLLRDVPVLGPLAALRQIVETRPVDSIFIALPGNQADRTNALLADLETSMADVRLAPDTSPAFTMRPNVSLLDGVPILSLRQTPLYGWNAVVKRGFDVVVGAACLLVATPPMLAIALLIKLTSPGPVLYRQRRMGLDGRQFTMLKFRSMRVDAEKESGAVWARPNDDRRTPIGRFLRRTSLDELPNLFNVLAGHMSLVGPRPERPELIARFKREIPNYMLRHKMKAGMTGYAQIKGLRGNTSLRKRIQHDVHYIRHWSLGLDIRILAQTIGAVWFSRHET